MELEPLYTEEAKADGCPHDSRYACPSQKQKQNSTEEIGNPV